jgi:hypothetical protein
VIVLGMLAAESERPGDTNLRLDYESARRVVTRVAKIGKAKPMGDIARPDSKMPGAPHVNTCSASHFELAVHPEIALGYPPAIEPPTKTTVGNKTTCA